MANGLLIVGGGSMGGAIARGVVRSGQPAGGVAVVDPNAERRSALAGLGIAVAERADEAPPLADEAAVLLAVKPQVWPEIAEDVKRIVVDAPTGRLVISVMAGVTTTALSAALGPAARIVRTMPNLGSLVGQGITAVAGGPGATEADRERAAAIFASIGQVMGLDEDLIDAFTGVAGSGPAYVFLLAEAMASAGEVLGMSRVDAARAARQTIIGAARVLESDDRDPAALRDAVTSPSGTTAAALEVLETHSVREIMAQAIRAARDRGRELGS